MPYTGEARWRFQGRQQDCAPYVRPARVLVERVVAMFGVGEVVDAATFTQKQSDGTVIKVTVFAESPPIITITPVTEQEGGVRRWLKRCRNGLYLDESVGLGEAAGHWNREDSPYTLVVANEPYEDGEVTRRRVHLANHRLDPNYEYPRAPAKNPRGTYTVPIATPVGPGYKSGDNGLLCFVRLHQTGFFWKTTLPDDPMDTEPYWVKCFVRGVASTSSFITPPYASPENITWPEMDRGSWTSDLFLRLVVDMYAVEDTTYGEERVLHSVTYDVTVPGDPTVDDPDAIPQGRIVQGRLLMQEATDSLLALSVVKDRPQVFPAEYTPAAYEARRMQETGRLDLSVDGTHLLYGAWNTDEFRYVESVTGEEAPYEGALYRGVPYGGGLVTFETDYAVTRLYDRIENDVIIGSEADHVYFWRVQESINDGDLEWTQTLTLDRVSVAPGVTLPDGWAHMLIAKPFNGAAGRAFMSEKNTTRSYDVLPSEVTKHGACKVSVDYTITNSVEETAVAVPGSSSGGVTWERENVGDNWTLKTQTAPNPGAFRRESREFFSLAGTLTVEAFGTVHEIPFGTDLEHYSDIEHEIFGVPIDTFESSTPFRMNVDQSRVFHSSDLSGDDGSYAIVAYESHMDGQTIDYHSLVGDPADERVAEHPATGAEIDLSFNWGGSGDRYWRPKFVAYIQDGILWVEMYWNSVGVQCTPPRNAAAGDTATYPCWFGRLWAFTTAGEKFVVEPRTTTDVDTFTRVVVDPSGANLPLEVAHDPVSKQTYLSYVGEQYPCMMTVENPAEHKARLPEGIPGDEPDFSA